MSTPIPDLDTAIANAAKTYRSRQLAAEQRAAECLKEAIPTVPSSVAYAEARAAKELEQARVWKARAVVAERDRVLVHLGEPGERGDQSDPLRPLWDEAMKFGRVRFMKRHELTV